MKFRKLVFSGLALLVTTAFAQPYTLGYVVQDLGNQFWITMAQGIEDKAAELGVEVVVLDSRTDPAIELANVEDLLSQGIDALLLSPWDATSGSTSVEAANRADVPVFVLDIGVESGDIVSFLVSDNYKGGVLAGKKMSELIGGEGTVVQILTQPGYVIPALRSDGFRDTVTEMGIEVVAEQSGDSQRALGLSVMENLLQSNPDIDGVFAANDEMAMGALEAIRSANKLDQIHVIGFDAIPDALAAIEEGTLVATVAQQPYLIGQMGVEMAVQHLNGEGVEPEVLVDVELITPENVNEQ